MYRQLTALGVRREVVAPSLVPVKSEERVKTDRRDALKLARSCRSGDLTPVWVPDVAHEALRDLVRARNRLSKFLLRHGKRPPPGVKACWSGSYLLWIKQEVHFAQFAQEFTLLDSWHEVEHPAGRVERLDRAIEEAVKSAPAQVRAVIEGLQALRGIAQVSAVTIVAELGQISRFPRARQRVGYSGAVPSEDSSGVRVRRGAITKTGNARRIVLEAAWSYRRGPTVTRAYASGKRWSAKAQHRLQARYRKLTARGKNQGQGITAQGRERLGFLWAIGVQVERKTVEGAVAAGGIT